MNAARFSQGWTRAKLAVVYGVLFAEFVALVWFGGPEAMKAAAFGGGDYAPSLLAKAFLAVIVLGIPGVLILTLTYLVTVWLALRPGELEEFEARRLLAGMQRPLPQRRVVATGAQRAYDE